MKEIYAIVETSCIYPSSVTVRTGVAPIFESKNDAFECLKELDDCYLYTVSAINMVTKGDL